MSVTNAPENNIRYNSSQFRAQIYVQEVAHMHDDLDQSQDADEAIAARVVSVK